MDEKRFVRLLWVVKACLLAVLVYAGFEVVVSRLHPGTARGEPCATATPVALPETRSPPDYGIIIQRNLFTEAEDANDVRAGQNRSSTLASMASAEELGLRLVGSIAGGPVASRAIIQDTKTNATGSYRIGDAVASTAVEAIQRDAVILRYQGRPLVLKLCAGTAADNPSKASLPNDKSDPGQRGRHSATDITSAGGTDAQTVPPNRVGYVAEVFRKATMVPYVKNHRTEGLKITGLDRIPRAEMFGFQNGDVIQSVNGQQLTSRQKAFQVLMKAKTQPQVNIQLLRDGKNKDLSFDL